MNEKYHTHAGTDAPECTYDPRFEAERVLMAATNDHVAAHLAADNAGFDSFDSQRIAELEREP